MCCSWLRCRRRVADSTDNNAPMEAFEKSESPAEEATEEQEKATSRKTCSYRTNINAPYFARTLFAHFWRFSFIPFA